MPAGFKVNCANVGPKSKVRGNLRFDIHPRCEAQEEYVELQTSSDLSLGLYISVVHPC